MNANAIRGLELSGLRALVAVGEHRTLLGAAAAENTSRGTLRRRLGQLEQAVGVRLYAQGPEGVHLTTAGNVLVEHTQRLLVELQGSLDDVHRAAQAPLRSIRALFPNGLHPATLVQGFAELAVQNPDLMIDMDFAPDPLQCDLTQYELLAHFGRPPATGFLVTREMLTIPEMLVASPRYLETHGTPTSPADLAEHRLLSWKLPGEEQDTWLTTDQRPIPVQPAFVSTDSHVVRTLAESGLGIARVLEGGLDTASEPAVVQVLPDHFHRSIPLRILIPEGLQRTPRMRMMVNAFEKVGIDLGLRS